MTDRELLELAAKAAGIDLYWEKEYTNQGEKYVSHVLIDGAWGHGEWNPLTSDADAFRLANKMSLMVDMFNERAIQATRYGQGHRDWTYASDDELHGGLEATRRAITRAAAAIGEQK